MTDSGPKRVSLAELADRYGTPVACAGNLPLRLDDQDNVWFIDRGSVNLFLLESRDEIEQAAPQFLLSREAGALLPGISPDSADEDSTLSVIAKGVPNTVLKRIPAARLAEVDASEVAADIDSWLSDITRTLARFVSYLPRPTALIEQGQTETVSPGTLSVQRDIVWVTLPPPGCGLFMGLVDQTELLSVRTDEGAVMPLTQTSWLTLINEVPITGHSTQTLAHQGTLLPALASFHVVAFNLERVNRRLSVIDDANLDRARTVTRRAAADAARRRLFNIYDLPDEQETDIENRSLIGAMEIIGKYQAIDFKIPPSSPSSDASLTVTDILDASGVRARRVNLKSEEGWWRGNSNAILAFKEETKQPVVLIPSAFGRYREIDPISKRSTRVSAKRAATLEPDAWTFYRPLPARELGPWDLLKFAMHGSLPDIVRLVLTGLPAGLIRLFPALFLGFIANHIMMGGSASVLYFLACVLAGFGVLGALLHLLQNSIMMRLEGRAASGLETAFWDRLMRLPSSLLHRRPVGDLAMSGMSFQNLRDTFQGAVADSLLSIIFLLPVFGVIFFYDVELGVITLVFSLVSLTVTVLLGLIQIAPQGRMIKAMRQVTGRLFQIIGGIAKLRIESAEGSAFDIWARDYRDQKVAELELGTIESHSRAVAAALPFLTIGVLLVAVLTLEDRTTPIGDFLVVFLVFFTFQLAIARLGESMSGIAAILPAFDQMRPLLSSVPEPVYEGETVDFLAGDILFDRVSFRYDPEGPLILDDVTIRTRPGEFVAIAGESGAGKSTIFRLALGLDDPTAGAVYYDGRDLRNLNLKQVRRKIGAVPQSVGLHPQDLWDNVVSHHQDIDADEVWNAARIAEIEDEIKNMPMGMLTMVGNTASVLSGGESQRVTIARSVIGNPRILLLDEATNWLDNESQAKVMQNLTLLTSTRIVIAHRLSTLEQADRIYVMQAGKVVQSGSFKELMAVEGVFQDLVKRQIA